MKLKQNILIVSAGRRVELLRAFQKSLACRIPSAKVYCADIKPELSSACVASGSIYRLPHVFDPEYPVALLRLCQELDIGMIVPTIDTELNILAQIKSYFSQNEIHIIISSLDLIKKCRDKRLTSELYLKLGIRNLKIYDHTSIQFPCFTKPFDGSGSSGAMRLDNRDQLTENMLAEPGRMFMELANPKWVEVTVDLYFDRESILRCAVPRERIATRNGEVSKGCTRKGWLYNTIIKSCNYIPGAFGCLTLQVFADEVSQHSYAIEINPRFGGGYPLSDAAGADFTGSLIDEYFFDKSLLFFDNWEDNLLMLRYDAKILVNNYGF